MSRAPTTGFEAWPVVDGADPAGPLPARFLCPGR